MAAEYKLVRRPPLGKTDGKQQRYPRFVPTDTVRLDDLVQKAQGRSSFSSADIKGVLQLLQDMMVDELMFGHNVELEGIGTFSISLKSRPVEDKKEIRAESIHFQDVTFRSSRQLRDRLQEMPLMRSSEEERAVLSFEECEERTMKYLETHQYISGKIYRSLCRCGKTKAAGDLKRMANAGKLVRKYIGNAYLFQPVKPEEEA